MKNPFSYFRDRSQRKVEQAERERRGRVAQQNMIDGVDPDPPSDAASLVPVDGAQMLRQLDDLGDAEAGPEAGVDFHDEDVEDDDRDDDAEGLWDDPERLDDEEFSSDAFADALEPEGFSRMRERGYDLGQPLRREGRAGGAWWSAAPRRPEPTRLRTATRLEIDGAILARFYAYAAAALPAEIGGLLRVVRDGETFRVIDLHVFPQKVSSVTFDLDGVAVARFMAELYTQGRGAECAEWSSLIHSHPSMQPFLSGRDQENIERLAGERHAWSLICSVWPDPERNYQLVHYHQSGPIELTLIGLEVSVVGAVEISDAEREQIEAETAALIAPRH